MTSSANVGPSGGYVGPGGGFVGPALGGTAFIAASDTLHLTFIEDVSFYNTVEAAETITLTLNDRVQQLLVTFDIQNDTIIVQCDETVSISEILALFDSDTLTLSYDESAVLQTADIPDVIQQPRHGGLPEFLKVRRTRLSEEERLLALQLQFEESEIEELISLGVL